LPSEKLVQMLADGDAAKATDAIVAKRARALVEVPMPPLRLSDEAGKSLRARLIF
jgi:hypothetical protein